MEWSRKASNVGGLASCDVINRRQARNEPCRWTEDSLERGITMLQVDQLCVIVLFIPSFPKRLISHVSPPLPFVPSAIIDLQLYCTHLLL